MPRNRKSVARDGDAHLGVYVPGAVALLRARGVPVSCRAVGSLVRLARSFVRDGMGRFEALSSAAALVAQRR